MKAIIVRDRFTYANVLTEWAHEVSLGISKARRTVAGRGRDGNDGSANGDRPYGPGAPGEVVRALQPPEVREMLPENRTGVPRFVLAGEYAEDSSINGSVFSGEKAEEVMHA